MNVFLKLPLFVNAQRAGLRGMNPQPSRAQTTGWLKTSGQPFDLQRIAMTDETTGADHFTERYRITLPSWEQRLLEGAGFSEELNLPDLFADQWTLEITGENVSAHGHYGGTATWLLHFAITAAVLSQAWLTNRLDGQADDLVRLALALFITHLIPVLMTWVRLRQTYCGFLRDVPTSSAAKLSSCV